MVRTANRFLLAVVLSTALAGCQMPNGSGSLLAGFGEVGLGPNLIGESCRLQPASPATGLPLLEPSYDVFCGAWERPSGRVVAIADAGEQPDQIGRASGRERGCQDV